jgi:hypothetical protein
MKIRSTLALLGTLAALAAGGAAQASDIQVTVRIADRGWSGPAADVEGEDFRPREFWRHEPRAYRRHGFEDRRIVERPHWARPIFARPWEEEDCRIVIKRRVDPWGDVVVRRFRVCG